MLQSTRLSWSCLLRSGSQRLLSTSCSLRSGHNKWSKIKDKKGANDMQKSILYTKANHEILTAARLGGSADPALNIQLATAMKKAKEQGVPKENIAKALARAGGAKDGAGTRLVYEALAFDSFGLMIECLTDNANRTLHNIREILTNRGARMAPVKFMFVRRGRVTIAVNKVATSAISNEIIDTAIENNAEDINELDDMETDDSRIMEFTCKPEHLAQLESSFRDNAPSSGDPSVVSILSSELVYVPCEVQDVQGEQRELMEELVRELEANSDTSGVWTSTSIRTQP